MDGENAVACRVIRELIAAVTGLANVRVVARYQQVADRVAAAGGPHRVHEKLVHGI